MWSVWSDEACRCTLLSSSPEELGGGVAGDGDGSDVRIRQREDWCGSEDDDGCGSDGGGGDTDEAGQEIGA